MDEAIKNKLGKALSLLAMALAFSSLFGVYVYSKTTSPFETRSFTISGEGKVITIPDVAQFSFSVITEGGKDIGKLQKENIEKMNGAVDYLKSQGIDKKDIKTTNYDVSPRYQNIRCSFNDNVNGVCPPAEIIGYSINQSVSVKIRDFEKVGDILAGVVDKGANNVSSLSFTIDDKTELENQAREKAISEAKSKALSIAEAGDFKVGKLISISDFTQPFPYYQERFYGMGGGADMAKSSIAPIVEAGSNEITSSVSLTYEIK